jgi:hypothetical protein
LEIRVIQSELMMSALNCQKAERYNAFINRERPALQAAHGHIARVFRRQYGGRGNLMLNDFYTRLGNEASIRRGDPDYRYCDRMDFIFDQLEAGEDGLDGALIPHQASADSHGFRACSPKPLVSTRRKDDAGNTVLHPLLGGTGIESAGAIHQPALTERPAVAPGDDEPGFFGRVTSGLSGSDDEESRRPPKGAGGP